MLTTGPDHTALLWDATTGRQIGGPFRHAQDVVPLAFSPDGKTVATGCCDNAARLWNVDKGEPIGRPMTTDGPVGTAVFSPNGKFLLTCTAETARLWNVDTGEPIGLPMIIDRDPLHHHGTLCEASCSPDAKTVLTYSRDGTVWLWDAATQQERNGSPLWRGELVPRSSVQTAPGS